MNVDTDSSFEATGGGLSKPLVDSMARRISYLRISVTDRCNYRCEYCMPAEGYPTLPRAALMSFEEIERFARVMVLQGVKRIRLTGGEPLARKGIVELVERLSTLPGAPEIVMTTNGQLLERFAEPLVRAGLTGLNVSLDSFDETVFERVTRGGSLPRVLAGIAAATAAGVESIKINAVAIEDVNGAELSHLVTRCWAEGWTPRFIELMPIGALATQTEQRRITTPELLRRLHADLPLEQALPTIGGPPRGPAGYWRAVGGRWAGHKVGLISPMSDEGFCASCNRARLTARGGFRACLANDDEVSVLRAMRGGASDAQLAKIAQGAVDAKLPSHRMAAPNIVPLSIMTAIGG